MEMEPYFDKIYDTAVPIDGRKLFVASQVIPVIKMKDGKHDIRPCIKYKNTINEHLMDEPHIYSICKE